MVEEKSGGNESMGQDFSSRLVFPSGGGGGYIPPQLGLMAIVAVVAIVVCVSVAENNLWQIIRVPPAFLLQRPIIWRTEICRPLLLHYYIFPCFISSSH